MRRDSSSWQAHFPFSRALECWGLAVLGEGSGREGWRVVKHLHQGHKWVFHTFMETVTKMVWAAAMGVLKMLLSPLDFHSRPSQQCVLEKWSPALSEEGNFPCWTGTFELLQGMFWCLTGRGNGLDVCRNTNDFPWAWFTCRFSTEKSDQCEIQGRITAQKCQSLWECPGSHTIPEDILMECSDDWGAAHHQHNQVLQRQACTSWLLLFLTC